MSVEIHTAGGIAVELATVAIQPTQLTWLNEFKSIEDLQQIIFISKNAVRHFFAGLKTCNLEIADKIEITCIGTATANLLEEFDYTADYIPQNSTSESLLELANLQNVANKSILLVKGIGGRTAIADELTNRGANLSAIEVYERIIPNFDKKLVNSIWQEDLVDIILFTSRQAMINTFSIFGDDAHAWLITKPCLVISPRLAAAAQDLGIKKIISASYKTIIEAIEGYQND